MWASAVAHALSGVKIWSCGECAQRRGHAIILIAIGSISKGQTAIVPLILRTFARLARKLLHQESARISSRSTYQASLADDAFHRM